MVTAMVRGLLARRGTKRRESGGTTPPETVRTLAVLMQAGAAPLTAWGHLADAGVSEASGVLDAVRRGDSLADGIRVQEGPWAEVAAAWAIASAVGAPLGDVLRAVAHALEDAESTTDEVRVALAEPTGTARLMLWLPAAGLLLGSALGFDALSVLFTHPVGIVCLVVGAGLVGLARLWTGALVRRAQPSPGIPGMAAELLAVALSGGASISRAVALVREEGDASSSDEASIRSVLRLSAAAGVPAVELLRAEAARLRRSARVRGRVDAARLSSRLLLPLGVCTLPAFLLLGIAPLVLGVLSTSSLPTAL